MMRGFGIKDFGNAADAGLVQVIAEVVDYFLSQHPTELPMHFHDGIGIGTKQPAPDGPFMISRVAVIYIAPIHGLVVAIRARQGFQSNGSVQVFGHLLQHHHRFVTFDEREGQTEREQLVGSEFRNFSPSSLMLS